MGDRLNYPLREDEEDIDFSDTRDFAASSYDVVVAAVKQTLLAADREKISLPLDWQKIQSEIRAISADRRALPIIRRLLIQAKISSGSSEKLTQTVSWMKRLRNVVEHFNRCLEVCEEQNEPRYAMVDILDCLLQILSESVRYLRKSATDTEGVSGWRNVEKRIVDNLNKMDAVIKHLSDINASTKINLERQIKTLNLRHGLSQYPEEHASFPIQMITRPKNENFYGRHEEIKNIDGFLGHSAPNLRTYTIYGRRGIGKTDIALEYAHTNPSNFEAIFWINSETSLVLRQSFTDMAVALNIPGADRNGYHEENQIAVLKWLKTTKRRWLLVFDNAERESILKSFWPVCVNGSILITSRKYYNFTNDAHRKGDTIKPFTPKESWNLLMKLLGPEWVEQDRKGLIKGREEMAATEMLKHLGGLALAIEQAAELIKNDTIGGPNIVSTYGSFKDHQAALPERPDGNRSETVRALDSLWNMRFTNLARNSLALLSVLALLSPDGISIDLFLPRNQQALDGRLAFCKQQNTSGKAEDNNTRAALADVINAPPLLRAAITELVSFKLIKQEGRELWAHRVVQEAMIYHSSNELQEFFSAAVALVHEAFPKQVHGDYLSDQWGACETYIPHGVHLSFQFANVNKSASETALLVGDSKFIDLLSNCAWFLYEISDYDLSLRLINSARLACQDKESLQYATLCMTAGSAYYELNQLSECRKNWETHMQIQEAKLPEGHLELSVSYHTMGNLEAADSSVVDNLEKAANYFERAIAIRLAGGDAANSLLAISYLCRSRVFFLNREYEDALAVLGLSEALFYRLSGADAVFMAHVHYAYGNIDFAHRRWDTAKRSYELGLRIGLANVANHPINAAAYYSLGCVEYERHNVDNARAYLDKAMQIAQLRSPNRDDGTMARIMWKKSVVLESETYGMFADEATELRIRAENALKTLTASGEGGIVFSVDEDGNPDHNELEDAYDSLVPGYFR